MSNKEFKIFISAVTTEFGHGRDMLANSLQARGLYVKIQRSFRNERDSTTTLEKLYDYISECDAFIGIVGDRAGTFPPPGAVIPEYSEMLPDGMEIASYTQWEVIFALHHGCRLSLHESTKNFHPDRLADDVGESEQTVWKSYLFDGVRGLDRKRFDNSDALRANVLEEDWPQQRTIKPRNLPYASIGTLFKGRSDELDNIHRTLNADKEFSEGSNIGLVLHGLGGIGKTRLAVEYGLKNEQKYHSLLFVNANSEEELVSNMANLAGVMTLNLPQKEEPDLEARYAAVLEWFRSNPGWLLIIDNADTKEAALAIEKLFVQLSGGHVLVTSRLSIWSPQFNLLGIGVLSPEASKDLLLAETPKRRVSGEDEVYSLLLAEKLGFLALALRQAGAYINQRRMTFETYVSRFEASANKLLGKEGFDEQVTGYPVSVAGTWDVTFRELSDNARELLQGLSLFSHEQIPENLFDTALSSLKKFRLKLQLKIDEDATEYSDQDALLELERFSFVNFDDDAPEFSIHRLVQKITRESIDDETRIKAESSAASVLLFAGMSLNETSDAVHGIREKLLPHAVFLTKNNRFSEKNSDLLVSFFSTYAEILQTTGRLILAEIFFQKALQLISALTFASKFVIKRHLLERYSILQLELGNFAAAEENLRAALNLVLTKFKFSKPEKEWLETFQAITDVDFEQFQLKSLLSLYDNLSVCLVRSGELEKVEEVFSEIDRVSTLLGNEANLRHQSHYAIFLRDTERYEEAEGIWREVVKKIDNSADISNESKADILNSFAVLKMRTGQFKDAVSLFEKSISYSENDQESKSLKKPIVLANLGMTHRELGNIENARANYASALEASYRLEDMDWQRVKDWMQQYASMEFEQGNDELAIEIHNEFIEQILERMRSELSVATVQATLSLLSMHEDSGIVGGIRQIVSEVLAAVEPFIPEKGDQSPYHILLYASAFTFHRIELNEEAEASIEILLKSDANFAHDDQTEDEALASLYTLNAEIKTHREEFEEAEKTVLTALRILDDRGSDERVHALCTLAEIQENLGKIEDAIETNQKASDMLEALHHTWGVQTAAVAFGIGLRFRNTAKFEQAENIISRVLMVNQEFYGPVHPETVVVKSSLILLQLSINNLKAASSLAHEMMSDMSKCDVDSENFQTIADWAFDAFLAVQETAGYKLSEIEVMMNSYFSHIDDEKFHITLSADS
ncbi:MAG: DUF4062 domain-containing protein [Pseudomonadota bacterium]